MSTSPPTLTSVAPTSGAVPVALTLTGIGLTGATGATVGGLDLGTLTVIDDATVTGTLPAGLGPGAYDVSVTTPLGTATLTAAFTVTPPIVPDWAPTVAEVAALEHARTKDTNGQELGTFTDATRPTDADVQPLIINACADVASHVGYVLVPEIQDAAKNLAIIYTACQIEEGFYPEQIAAGRSPWDNLWQRYQFGIAELEEAAAAFGGSTLAAGRGSIYVASPTMASRAGWPWWGSETLSPGVGSFPNAQASRAAGLRPMPVSRMGRARR